MKKIRQRKREKEKKQKKNQEKNLYLTKTSHEHHEMITISHTASSNTFQNMELHMGTGENFDKSTKVDEAWSGQG